jgi:triphosphoribosyl-dephospho-CoA synthetase
VILNESDSTPTCFATLCRSLSLAPAPWRIVQGCHEPCAPEDLCRLCRCLATLCEAWMDVNSVFAAILAEDRARVGELVSGTSAEAIVELQEALRKLRAARPRWLSSQLVTAIELAAGGGHVEILRLLLQFGLSVHPAVVSAWSLPFLPHVTPAASSPSRA